MKRTIILLILFNISLTQYGQIVADHTVVDRYDDIPQYYIDQVKKMWLTVPGESHSQAYRTGLLALETLNPVYAASVIESGTPEPYTSSHLRSSRATWGSYREGSTGWVYFYGEEDWFTSAGSVAQTKAGITYCNTHGLNIGAIGFGWCYDPDINYTNINTYLSATQEYIDYCRTNDYSTEVFFTTGPIDGTSYTNNGRGGEYGYNIWLRYEAIRDYVALDDTRVLFDYSDILSHDASGTQHTLTWDGNTYEVIAPGNLGGEEVGHIGEVGALRLAKAMWWMLARIAGWDGGAGSPSGTWIGTTTDWNAGSNWYGGIVPTTGTDVTIPLAAHQPVISGAQLAECNNLTINSGASLTINSGRALTVNGNFSGSGTIIIESEYSEAEPDGLTLNGSLIVIGTSSGNVTYNRSLRPKGAGGDRHFISSPVGGQSMQGFITANSSDILRVGSVYQIWEWNEIGGDWPIISTGNFIAGKGYNLSQATGGDGSFTMTGLVVKSADVTATSPYVNGYTSRTTAYDYGLNNNNSIWVPGRSWTNYGGGGWNLMGNPFTSAMDAAAFISTNDGKFDPYYEALYVYDGLSDKYEFAAASIPGFPQSGTFGSIVQAGQGFFVLALYNNIVFNFRSVMQVHSTITPMLKSALVEEPWPGLQLKVKYGSDESITTIVYNNEMTAGLDPGYDVGQYSTGPDVELYTSLVLKENDVSFARQALPVTDCDKHIVPVGIDSEKGGEVTFSAYSVPLANYNFWLEDRSTGIFTDLNSNSYAATLPANTFGTGRFFIYASTNIPTADSELPEVAELRVWTYNGKVIIKGAIGENATCEVYDLQGQKLLISRLADAELNIVDISSISRGVFVVRVVNGLKVYNRKIALL